MGLRQVSGKKVPVNYALDRQVNVKDPTVVVYESGKTQFSARCADLLAVTGVDDPEVLKQVMALAESFPDDAPWTKEQVAALCEKVGKLPFPKYVLVEHLEGQATLLFNVVQQQGEGVAEFSYSRRSARPTLNLLPALKDEEIKLVGGMCLEAPVALVLDDGVLKVEVALRKGKVRPVKVREEGQGAASPAGQ
jgi:hypothetical protein